MAMSSFLMNSSPYVEPKFPPNEEYSQNNYLPSQHGEDYYQRQANAQSYASYMRDSRVHHHYGGGGAGQESNFSPGVGYPTTHSGGGGGGVGGGRPPPPPLPNHSHGPVVNQGVTPVDSHGIPATGGQPYPSPAHPHSDSPNSVPSPSPAPNTPVNGMTQCSQNNSGPAVIYPWMKRVHCGQGKNFLLFPSTKHHKILSRKLLSRDHSFGEQKSLRVNEACAL